MAKIYHLVKLAKKLLVLSQLIDINIFVCGKPSDFAHTHIHIQLPVHLSIDISISINKSEEVRELKQEINQFTGIRILVF